MPLGMAIIRRTEFDSLVGKVGNLSVKWRKSSENLELVDTLFFEDRSTIRQVFRKSSTERIVLMVYRNINKPQIRYYFASQIGLIKIVDPAKWDASYYLLDNRTKRTLKFTSELNTFIKSHYPDPPWLEVFEYGYKSTMIPPQHL